MASSISITGFLMFLYVILTFFAAASAIVRVSVEQHVQQVNTYQFPRNSLGVRSDVQTGCLCLLVYIDCAELTNAGLMLRHQGKH